MSARSHYHVSFGLAGYGPDADESTPTLETLSDALECARDDLERAIDGNFGDAHVLAESGDYERAWHTLERMWSLETLRANLDPARQSAPLYRDDAAAYAALQESQAAEFPVDTSEHDRLYLWSCTEDDCGEDES